MGASSNPAETGLDVDEESVVQMRRPRLVELVEHLGEVDQALDVDWAVFNPVETLVLDVLLPAVWTIHPNVALGSRRPSRACSARVVAANQTRASRSIGSRLSSRAVCSTRVGTWSSSDGISPASNRKGDGIVPGPQRLDGYVNDILPGDCTDAEQLPRIPKIHGRSIASCRLPL
jgi:hypothetical protein